MVPVKSEMVKGLGDLINGLKRVWSRPEPNLEINSNGKYVKSSLNQPYK